MLFLKHWVKDFAGGPVVKTSSSNVGVGVQTLTGELKYHMLHGWKTRTQATEIIL